MSDLMSLRVRALTWEAEGVLGVELVRTGPDGHTEDLPPFEAGAHVDLHLPNQVVRSYSLCNAPGETQRYVLGVGRDRASRGGSRYVHEQLRPGALLPVSAPRNHFRLNEAAPSFALVAGGIGVTPILAMARRLAVLGKPVQAFYAARSRAAAAYAQELAALVPGLELHLDDTAGGPPDIAGWLARLPKDSGAYCCGPAPMLDAFEKGCAALGLTDAHVERFSAPVVATEALGAYRVVLERSGRTVEVATGANLLDTLLASGLDVMYSCKEGICGTCETRVLAGDIEHRDSVLSDAEKSRGDVMMVCVSGCKGQRLVLDL